MWNAKYERDEPGERQHQVGLVNGPLVVGQGETDSLKNIIFAIALWKYSVIIFLRTKVISVFSSYTNEHKW